MLDRDLWGTSGPRMPLEVMTALSLWPGVKDLVFCLVIGGKSEWGRVQSQTGKKGKKEERNKSSSIPAVFDLHTSGNPGLRFPSPSQQNPTNSLKFSE